MGSLDLLTEALGTKETRGRVHGMGRYVTPHQYFLIPRNVKQYLKQYDRMMNKRLKAVEDELERRRCASTNAWESASNSPTLSDEDEEPNVPSEPNVSLHIFVINSLQFLSVLIILCTFVG